MTDAAFKATGFGNLSSGGTTECEPPAGSIPPGNTFQSVKGRLSGLISGTTYHYRLVATSSGELGGAATSQAAAFTAPHAPTVSAESVSEVTSRYATLTAKIAPLGSDTQYWVEYVLRSTFASSGFAGATQTAHVDLGIGGPGGNSIEPVVVRLSGLAPSTSYDVRFVATNAIGPAEGTAVEFATVSAASAGLPDGRQYELVTPPQKDGGSDMFGGREVNGQITTAELARPSQSGNQLILETHAGFGPFPGNESSAYVLSRASSGWSFQSLASPSLGVQNIGSALPSAANFEQVALDDNVGSLASEAGQQIVNLLGSSGGPYMTLHSNPPVHLKEAQELKLNETNVVGASSDLSRIILAGPNNLCSGASHVKAGGTLCEWNGVELKLVDVNNTGTVISNCGATLGKGRVGGRAYRAVSAEGDRLFFTAPDPAAENEGGACWNGGTLNAPQLYMRVGGETVDVSAPESGVVDPSGQHVAEYAGASEDGHRVFFLTRTELTKEAQTLGLHDLELYEYDTVDRTLARVSRGGGGVAANVEAAPAISADGSTVYFLAYGALAPGAEPLPEPSSGVDGDVNLYRYDTATQTTTFVAPLSTFDYISNNGVCTELGGGAIGKSTSLCPTAEWQTTRDGRFVVFDSVRSLAGATTSNPGGTCVVVGTQGFGTGHCDQLYRYDSTTGQITCVSCNPSGAAPTSDATFGLSAAGAAFSSGLTAMSEDGSYVFFQTKDALVPQDANGTLDVYEWHDGVTSLLSGGTSTGPSFFLDSTPDGTNVFFGTHARLVPTDTDDDGDVYDARICTSGEPCISYANGVSGECEGTACQALQPEPPQELPASLRPSEGDGKSVNATTVARKATLKTHKARGTRFALTIVAPAGGSLTVTGGSVKRVLRKVARAGSYRIMILLNPKARSRLRKKHQLMIPLELLFSEVGAAHAAQTSCTVKVSMR